MKSKFFTLLFGLFIIPSVIGWGDEGHQIIGYIAQKLLNPEVDNHVVTIIQEPNYHGQLANLAYWADYETEKYPWSKELHYADTNDDPPVTCFVDYGQICPGDRCLMGAIVNYTQRLDCDSGLDAFQRDEALKFLTHFMGDISQPLHVCGKMGGIRTKVKIKRKLQRRPLHYVWDMDIPRTILKDEAFNKDFKLYGEFLLEKIRAEYADEVESWYACNVNDLPNLLECVLPWAVEINAVNCEFAWHYTKGEMLFEGESSYYERAKPIVDKLFARGGYRLARLLNDLLSKASCGSTGDEEKGHNDDDEEEGHNDDDEEEGHNDDDEEEGHNDDDEEEGHNDDDEEEGHNDDEDDD